LLPLISFLVCVSLDKGYPVLLPMCCFFLLRVKNLSGLKRSTCVHLFLMIVSRALKEEMLIGNPSWCGFKTMEVSMPEE
jgi:hypothetical protein